MQKEQLLDFEIIKLQCTIHHRIYLFFLRRLICRTFEFPIWILVIKFIVSVQSSSFIQSRF